MVDICKVLKGKTLSRILNITNIQFLTCTFRFLQHCAKKGGQTKRGGERERKKKKRMIGEVTLYEIYLTDSKFFSLRPYDEDKIQLFVKSNTIVIGACIHCIGTYNIIALIHRFNHDIILSEF